MEEDTIEVVRIARGRFLLRAFLLAKYADAEGEFFINKSDVHLKLLEPSRKA